MVAPARHADPHPTPAYDASGFRVRTKEYTGTPVPSHVATRDFYYTPQWQCIEERVTDVSTSTTTLDRQYFWGLRYVDDLVRRDRDTTGNGVLDETLYALNDRQFNVTALWDPTAGTTGEVVERMAYTPYGTPQFLNEDFTTKGSSSYAWTHLFQGLRRDPATGLYWNRRRDLHSLLGRFMQIDPLGYPDGLNAYAGYHILLSDTDPFGTRHLQPPATPAKCAEAWAVMITYGQVRRFGTHDLTLLRHYEAGSGNSLQVSIDRIDPWGLDRTTNRKELRKKSILAIWVWKRG